MSKVWLTKFSAISNMQTTENETFLYFPNLPQELHGVILSKLSLQDLLACTWVSHEWKEIIYRHHLIEDKFSERFGLTFCGNS